MSGNTEMKAADTSDHSNGLTKSKVRLLPKLHQEQVMKNDDL